MKKEERILTLLGEVDEAYIAEANIAETNTAKVNTVEVNTAEVNAADAAIAEAANNIHPSAKYRRLKWGTAAACAAIAVYACIHLLTIRVNPPAAQDPVKNGTPNSDPAQDSLISENPPAPEELPILTSRFDGGSMGFEGLLYYEISEAENANPWTAEHAPSFLPVYRNPAYTDGSGLTVNLGDEAMLALAEQTAAALGTSIARTEYRHVNDIIDYHIEGLSGTESYSLAAETALGEITVYGNGQIRISLSNPVNLPAEYSFTYSQTTDEEALDTIRYLTEQYSGLCAFGRLIADTGGDYTYYGDRIRYYQAYDGEGDLTQQILNYHFDTISFAPDDDGNLFVIWLGNLLTGAQKVGDYPLISADTARNFLLNGDYLTTVPSDYLADGTISEAQIAKTELVYRTGNTNELFMPYYRFYVALTNDHVTMTDGLTCYGIYYVPAVSGEYLSDFPVWNGQFH